MKAIILAIILGTTLTACTTTDFSATASKYTKAIAACTPADYVVQVVDCVKDTVKETVPTE